MLHNCFGVSPICTYDFMFAIKMVNGFKIQFYICHICVAVEQCLSIIPDDLGWCMVRAVLHPRTVCGSAIAFSDRLLVANVFVGLVDVPVMAGVAAATTSL